MAFVDPVRLCKPCSEVTKVEEEFFTQQIKVLFEGALLYKSLTYALKICGWKGHTYKDDIAGFLSFANTYVSTCICIVTFKYIMED